jgi:Ca2+-binding RTX toxin-like protein
MAIINGTNGNDKEPYELKGTELADEIFGLGGDDTLVGFGGDDVLEGGTGADELFGSGGLDYASYKGSATGVQVILNEDLTAYANRGDATGDKLFSIEGVIGSASGDSLSGNSQRNVLRGEGGADFISASAGSDQLVGGGGNDELAGGFGDDELIGGDGNDTAGFSDYSHGPVVADLAAGTADSGELGGHDVLSSIENLLGSTYDDQLAGNAGANRLEGEEGADELAGRGGADRFYYYNRYDSMPTLPDHIFDFSRSQGDKIDLARVDANERAPGNEAFQFVGQAGFTGPGQLRSFQQDGHTIIEANTDNSTASTEMRIVLDPLVSLQATDFVL